MIRWTLPMVRRLRARHRAGETMEEIAASIGTTRASVQGAFRRYTPDGGPGRAHGRTVGIDPEREKRLRRAWALRCDGATWPVIAERVRWPGSAKSLNGAALRYARRIGLDEATTPAPELVIGATRPGVCRIRDCRRAAYARGLCNACYTRAHRLNVLDRVAAPHKRRTSRDRR